MQKFDIEPGLSTVTLGDYKQAWADHEFRPAELTKSMSRFAIAQRGMKSGRRTPLGNVLPAIAFVYPAGVPDNLRDVQGRLRGDVLIDALAVWDVAHEVANNLQAGVSPVRGIGAIIAGQLVEVSVVILDDKGLELDTIDYRDVSRYYSAMLRND